ncbi:hypothetical protein [Arvimicrobium flavum]|uniref:hypothetical protein n=1 Tax=Arvimicrobium flavum TaxID=3393320 RepID=UPI00237A7495|nr:hypothetical protein [Mesorhizobium shangrilense]
MTAKGLSPQEEEELLKLYALLAKAAAYAGEMLAEYGIRSRQFAEAEQNAGDLNRKLQKLLGRIVDFPEG